MGQTGHIITTKAIFEVIKHHFVQRRSEKRLTNGSRLTAVRTTNWRRGCIDDQDTLSRTIRNKQFRFHVHSVAARKNAARQGSLSVVCAHSERMEGYTHIWARRDTRIQHGGSCGHAVRRRSWFQGISFKEILETLVDFNTFLGYARPRPLLQGYLLEIIRLPLKLSNCPWIPRKSFCRGQ